MIGQLFFSFPPFQKQAERKKRCILIDGSAKKVDSISSEIKKTTTGKLNHQGGPLKYISIIGKGFLIVFLLVGITASMALSAPSSKTAPMAAKQSTTPSSTSTLPAIKTERLSVLRQAILTEKDLIEKLQTEVTSQKNSRDKDLAQLQNKTVTETMLKQARLAVEATRVNIQFLNLDLSNENKKIQGQRSNP